MGSNLSDSTEGSQNLVLEILSGMFMKTHDMSEIRESPVLVCGCQKFLLLLRAKKATGRTCPVTLRCTNALSQSAGTPDSSAESPAEAFTSQRKP